jgi:hypothetical protein
MVAHRALKVAEREDDGQLFFLTLKNLPGQEEASINSRPMPSNHDMVKQEMLSVMRLVSWITLC